MVINYFVFHKTNGMAHTRGTPINTKQNTTIYMQCIKKKLSMLQSFRLKVLRQVYATLRLIVGSHVHIPLGVELCTY